MQCPKGNKGKKRTKESKKKYSEVNTGKKLSEETKEKISMAMKGNIHSIESVNNSARKHQKSVVNLTTNKEFSSIKEASEYYNIGYNSICTACKGKYVTAGGFKWSYTDGN